jgi:hypothetical protein
LKCTPAMRVSLELSPRGKTSLMLTRPMLTAPVGSEKSRSSVDSAVSLHFEMIRRFATSKRIQVKLEIC